MADLIEYFQGRSGETLELIRALVEHETPSGNPELASRLSRFLADLCQELGATVELIESPAWGPHLLARFSFGNSEGAKQILIIGHIDTVWQEGTLARKPFRIEDGKGYGPGIFDMKSSVAYAIQAIRAIRELGRGPRRPVSVLLTTDEERGSVTSRAIVEAEASRAVAALVLEPPLPGGRVKTQRKGVGRFEVFAYGRAAHAGVDPQSGVSAIEEMAYQILNLHQMTDYRRGTTVNVGVVKGGTLSNVVAAEARAVVDLRFVTMKDGEEAEEKIRSLQPVLKGARIEVSGGINRPPLERGPHIVALYEKARLLAAELGFDLPEGATGGGSDGCFTAAMGVPTLDGLGVDGAGAHAENEHIIIGDIPRRAALLVRLLETL